MLQRQYRLRDSADFDRVRTQGRTWRHPLLTLGLLPNQLPYNRVGFVVGKRLGKATVRNRAKRLLREAIRLSWPQLKPGFDIVLVARNEMVGQSYTIVSGVLDDLAKRAGLWREVIGGE